MKKAMNEVGGSKLDVADVLSLIIAVAEANNAVVEGFQTAVGNGDAEDVTGKIIEHLDATARVLGMNDPANLPDSGWNESKKLHFLQAGTELGTEYRRQSGIGNEKTWMFWRDPGLAIGGESSGGDEHVNVRMEEHGTSPGVKHGQSADACAEP